MSFHSSTEPSEEISPVLSAKPLSKLTESPLSGSEEAGLCEELSEPNSVGVDSVSTDVSALSPMSPDEKSATCEIGDWRFS